jgi:hypothetical protein
MVVPADFVTSTDTELDAPDAAVAVIVAVPFLTAVTSPLLLTFATAVLLELQVSFL